MLRDDPKWNKKKIVTIVKDRKEKDNLEFVTKQRQNKDIAEPDTEFGTLWHLFFKPSEPVEKELTEAMKQGNLAVKQYVATHCRVRHPGRINFLGKNNSDIMTMTKNAKLDADRAGLIFEGRAKDMMLDVGTHALFCANLLRNKDSENVYFFSDSDDLVRHMVAPVASMPLSSNISLSGLRSESVKHALMPGKIVSRNLSTPTVHLHLEKAPDVSYYYGTFLDLYMAVAARCVSLGIGNYAFLSSKISNTDCLQNHELFTASNARRWGTDLSKIRGTKCPVPAYSSFD